MGLFFPVYPPEDLDKLDQQKRGELKAAIRQVLHNDPDIKNLIKEKLPEVQKLLKDKTWDVYQKLRDRK
jgi:formaldehyde-activating enzyme involved in methanogenesis